MSEHEPLMIPMLKAVGVMRGVLDLAGHQARQDVRRELPGVYPLLCLASLFRPLSPLARGVSAVVMTMLGLAGSFAYLGWLFGR